MLCMSGCNQSKDFIPSGYPLYIQAIPQSFIYQGFEFKMVENDKVAYEKGELLGYLIRSSDIEKFREDYPNIDYVIDDGVYDLYTNHRVPFYKIIGFDNLDYICCETNKYQKVKEENK